MAEDWRTHSEFASMKADADWWTEWGAPFGLRLDKWINREVALFTVLGPSKSHGTVRVEKGGGLYELLDLLRPKLAERDDEPVTLRMEDNFTIKEGEQWVLRREGPAGRVTLHKCLPGNSVSLACATQVE